MFEPFVEFGIFSQHIRYDASRCRNDTGATIKPAQKVAVCLVVPRLRAGHYCRGDQTPSQRTS
jgi:hypothetical protein